MKIYKTNSHRRTTQFCLRNIQFQCGHGTIPFNSPASRFLNTLVVTLFLETQKHSVRGESIIMDNTRLILGFSVVTCAWRFLHLHKNDADLNMLLCENDIPFKT